MVYIRDGIEVEEFSFIWEFRILTFRQFRIRIRTVTGLIPLISIRGYNPCVYARHFLIKQFYGV